MNFPKLDSCIQVETACLIFAIISLLVTSVSCLASIVLLIYQNVITYVYIERMLISNESVLMFYSSIYIIFLSVSFGIMAVSLAFSIILTKGLIWKKPHLVKAYYIYGVTQNILWVLGNLLFFLILNISFLIVSVIGCVIYSLVLVMVKNTYIKMSSTNYEYDEFIDKKQLSEKLNCHY